MDVNNQKLAENNINQLLEIFKKEQFFLDLKKIFWALIQLICKFNKGYRLLLCVINIFSKYAWVFPLKDKKGVTITNNFQKILNNSMRKRSKIWVDKGSGFYNSSFKKWLKDNGIEMYSTHKEGKS